MIQCARLAFGYVGIYDQDEAEAITSATPRQGKVNPVDIVQAAQAEKPAASQELINRMEAAADRGYDVFSEEWASLEKHERQSFTAEQIQSFKERTEKVIEAAA